MFLDCGALFVPCKHDVFRNCGWIHVFWQQLQRTPSIEDLDLLQEIHVRRPKPTRAPLLVAELFCGEKSSLNLFLKGFTIHTPGSLDAPESLSAAVLSACAIICLSWRCSCKTKVNADAVFPETSP